MSLVALPVCYAKDAVSLITVLYKHCIRYNAQIMHDMYKNKKAQLTQRERVTAVHV